LPPKFQQFLPQHQNQLEQPTVPPPTSTSVPAITRPQISSPLLNNGLPQSISAPVLSRSVRAEEDIPSVVDEFGEHHHISEYEEEVDGHDYFSERYDSIAAVAHPQEVREDDTPFEEDYESLVASLTEEDVDALTGLNSPNLFK